MLEGKPGLTASELARRTYGSFSTAWRVKHDWALISGSRRAALPDTPEHAPQ
jgi:hypothetical protein